MARYLQPLSLELTLDNLKDEQEASAWSSWVHLFTAKIRDGERGRWTDAYVQARFRNGRVSFMLSHSRGYPSEDKGTADKTIQASWLSDKLPSE